MARAAVAAAKARTNLCVTLVRLTWYETVSWACVAGARGAHLEVIPRVLAGRCLAALDGIGDQPDGRRVSGQPQAAPVAVGARPSALPVPTGSGHQRAAGTAGMSASSPMKATRARR